MHEIFLISWKNNLKKIYDFFQGGSILKIQEMIFPNHQKPDEHLTNGLFQKELSKQIGWRNIWIKCRLWQLFSLIWVGRILVGIRIFWFHDFFVLRMEFRWLERKKTGVCCPGPSRSGCFKWSWNQNCFGLNSKKWNDSTCSGLWRIHR